MLSNMLEMHYGERGVSLMPRLYRERNSVHITSGVLVV